MTWANTFSLGALTIYATDINLIKRAGTSKQIIGGRVVVRPMPDKDETQLEWAGTITGIFWEQDRDTSRDTLQSYRDDLVTHTLTDGNHDGEYYVLDIRWPDSWRNPTSHRFVLNLVQVP